MAEITGATVTFTDYTATPADPRMLNIPDSWGDAEVQDILDTLSAQQAELESLIYDPLLDIPDTAGKQQLSTTKLAGLITVMVRTQVKFEDLAGPGYTTKRVLNGSLVAIDGETTRLVIEEMANSAFVNWKTEADVSAALLNPTGLAALVWAALAADNNDPDTMGEQLIDARSSAAYHDKSIHIDTVSGVAGSVVGVNGTEGNPVDNEADALTLAAAVGTDRFRVAGSLTLSTDYSGWSFEAAGAEALVDLNGRTIADCIFREVQIFGTMVAGADRNKFDHVALISVSGLSGVAEDCRLFGAIGMGNQQTLFLRCSGGDDSAELDYTAVTTGAPPTTITGYRGPLVISNVTRPQDIAINVSGGTVDLSASCGNGAFVVTGVGTLTDATTGTATVDAGSLLVPGQLFETWQLLGLDVNESVTRAVPTGDGVGFEGVWTVGTMVFSVEQQSGGDTVIVTRTA